jgi:hypothetical protein
MAEVRIKVGVDSDEWYPVYSATTDHKRAEYTVTVDASRFEWWQRATDEFNAAQKDMREAIGEASDG